MKRQLWLGSGIIGLFILLFNLMSGCGGAPPEDQATGLVSAVNSMLGTGLEDVSAADVQETSGNTMGALAANPGSADGWKEIAPAGTEPALLPPLAPPWWLFLHPARPRAREEVRDIIEAPAFLAYYIVTHPGQVSGASIVDSGNCPFDPSSATGNCTKTITFTPPCSLTFLADGHTVTLNLSGTLTRTAAVVTPSSGPLLWDGKWSVTDTATAFRVTDPVNSKWIEYNGKLGGVSDGAMTAPPYDWHHTWTIDAVTPLTLTDDLGRQLGASGTRELYIYPGNSAEQRLDTTLSWKPAGALKPFRVHRVMDRYLILDGNTTEVIFLTNTTLLDFGNRLWQHAGDFTLVRISPTKVKVNGHGQIMSPQAKLANLQLLNVVQDLIYRVPISGQAFLAFSSGLKYTFTFTGACKLHWSNNQGGAGNMNYCSWDSFQE